MKKKIVVLAALVLAVVVTAYSVSGTYAKYTTKIGDKAGTGYAAVWSFNSEVDNTVDLFKKSYTTTDGKYYVKGLSNENVIAPGTEGLYKVNITGVSEVAYTLSILSTDYENTVKLGNYSPILFNITIKENSNVIEAGWNMSLEGAITKLNEKLVETPLQPTTAAGSNLELTIEWFWAFDEKDLFDRLNVNNATEANALVEGPSSDNFISDDAKDTALGNKAYELYKKVVDSTITDEERAEIPSVNIKISVHATQVNSSLEPATN